MKTFSNVILASLTAFALVSACPTGNDKSKTSNSAAAASSTSSLPGNNAAAAVGAVTRGATTIVMKEVGGIAGNECLTFRNNGEMVDAACVNTAADRQVTPSTTASGSKVLLVQRSFDAGFRSDLVGVSACVGFDGTIFKAMDCAKLSAAQSVSLVGGVLKTGDGAACQKGHDAKAQLTIDTAGKSCVGVTTTNVAPTTT